MEKLTMQSHDVTGSNTQKIAQLFPNCVTERLGKDGKPELAIDFEKLQAELSNEIIAEGEERYQFTWPDKRAAVRLANTPTTMTLRPCREESVDFDNTQNLYIEGDNLDVLKVLRETYLGKVKMIYIDPPYNTGNDFVYNDDFAQGKNDFEQSSGLFDEEGNQTIDPMQRNTESNGRFHTDWLNMIYPRLKVARDLLSEDGVIFISIDDNEERNLKNICDEVFGNSNFIAMLPTVMNLKGNQDEYAFAGTHEYTCVYTKNKELKSFGYFDIDESDDEFSSWENDEIGYYKKGANLKSTGVNAPREKRPNLFFPIYINGDSFSLDYFEGATEILPITDGKEMSWRWSKDKFNNEKHNVIISNENGKISLYKKQRPALGELPTKKPKTLFYKPEYSSGNGTAQVKELFGEKIFSNPKPFDLVKDFIKVGTNNDAIILDFFSGSATTAHAVMKLNAEDGGNRKFIMVQLPEKTDEKSEAYKAGYKNICEIGKERIRRAGAQIVGAQRAASAGNTSNDLFNNADAARNVPTVDVGFRVLKLDSSNMEDVYYTPQDFDAQSLFNENVKADRTNEDLLFQVMLNLGIELSAKIESKQIAGKEVHFVDDNYLVACFDRDVNESTITEIAKLQPIYFVMRDASAANDNVIDNFEQIFKHYSPETVCRII
ncbi:MAG: site-specific DNA-methyltransferase [Bacteroidaceae bacterium]|nr:site-specific DNA-methyltransferase [Bacteroidaceae bacterium]